MEWVADVIGPRHAVLRCFGLPLGGLSGLTFQFQAGVDAGHD
jgi:hypothetical protein